MKPLRILSVAAACLLPACMALAFMLFKDARQNALCKNLAITLQNGGNMHFISEATITATLKQAGLYPVGQRMNAINTDRIEKELLRNEILERVNAYKTPSGILRVDVKQKTPILRVTGSGGDYYIDSRGGTMPASWRYAAHVPVAGGYVRKELATTELYKFALFLQEDDFWGNQIEQIYIHPDREVELSPRVGEHRIILGTMDNFREKLDNLRLFYEQAIPKTGWEKYRIINLKFKNQIVCTKK
jgi:cell division protein FtsQ